MYSHFVLHVHRALAHVIRHPASEHTDDIGLGQHYENIQTRITVNSLRKYCDLKQHTAPHTPRHTPTHIHMREQSVHALVSKCLCTRNVPPQPELAAKQEVVESKKK